MESFDSKMATLPIFKEIWKNSLVWIWKRYLILHFRKHYSHKANTDILENKQTNDNNTRRQSRTKNRLNYGMTDKAGNTKQELICCSTCLSDTVFINPVAVLTQLK